MSSSFTHAVVLDFEATCDEPSGPPTQEVIEFPSVLIDTSGRVIDSFESFVRPVVHPTLSAFCTELTSIEQSEVDGARAFPEVFAAHAAWMQGHGLTHENTVLVTCGDWDLARMLPAQLRTSGIADVPRLYSQWLNLKVPFKHAYPNKRVGMAGMLRTLGLELIGRHHRGIDDCHNIARILTVLLERGASLQVSKQWRPKAWPPLPLVLDGQPIELHHRSMDTLRGLANKLHQRKVSAVLHQGVPLEDPRYLPAGTALTSTF